MEASELNALVDAATARLAEKAAAEKVAADAKIASDNAAVEAYKATLEPAWKGGFATKKLSGKDSKNEATDAFLHYIRTGDAVAIKAMTAMKSNANPMLEGTDSLGGVLVPEDFYNQIIGIRNQRAWTRSAGLRFLTVGSNDVKIPGVETATGEFVRVAEAGAYDEDAPYIGPTTITVHKWTKIMKLSEELLADQKANLEAFIAQDLGEKMAVTESHYVAAGTGASQHWGIISSGGAATDAMDSATFPTFSSTDQMITFSSAGEIEAEEIIKLFYTPSDAYAENAVWLMNRQTLGYLRGLTSSAFAAFPGGEPPMTVSAGGARVETLLGRPVFCNSNVPVHATGIVSIALFDPSCYMVVENGGLVVRRLNELYAANGEVAIRAHFRQGGSPVQPAGFFYGINP